MKYVQTNTFESSQQFSSSASKHNEKANTISNEDILLSDSCVERIKEIADDSSYLRVMVMINQFTIIEKWNSQV